MNPVRTLPKGWEREIQRILRTVGEDTTDIQDADNDHHPTPTQVAVQALKLGFELALRERDSIIDQFIRLSTGSAGGRNIIKSGVTTTIMDVDEPLSAAHLASQLDSITMSSPKLTNREYEVNSRRPVDNNCKPMPSPKLHQSLAMSEMLIEPVEEEGSERCTWEYLSISLTRVAGYGFGIAVSGGRDNPHFKHGEPSIVVSDVLRAGPAWGQLHINDRIVNANGVSLENSEYSQAVQIMKDSDHLNLIVKRRVPVPTLEFEQRTLKFTLSKSRKKDDFGIVLGCKFYIRDITNPRLAEKDPGLKEGDAVMRINGMSCEDMSLSDARKLLDKSREKLALVIQRDVPRGTACKWPSQQTLYERLGSMSMGDTPVASPRASPMPMRNDQERMNNGRLSGRYGRMASSEVVYSPQRQSYSSQPGSRCRTPSYGTYDDYGNLMLPQAHSARPNFHGSTTPIRPLSPMDDAPTPVAGGAESPGISAKPPLPMGLPDSRAVSFLKEGGSVGVRVIGGNEVGIFVSAVQTGSPAAVKGVKPGDKILRVNARDMKGVTREEAVLFLLGLQDQVELMVQYRKEEYDRIRMQNLGDNFYIRAHFDYDKPDQGEMCFKRGDILQVTDTLFGGSVGAWQAIVVSSPGGESAHRSEAVQVKGVIPNCSRAEQLLAADTSRARATNAESKSATFLRRKMGLGRRSKSLTKGHWDEVVFSHGAVNFPAYERVHLKHPGFLRPVVLFGPLADVARDLLLKDFPLRFAAPVNEKPSANGIDSKADPPQSSGIVRLSSIREVMDKKKHCVLDVTPSSVYKLQYAQYSPVVIYINVDTRNRLRDLRAKHATTATLGNSSRKILEQSARIQKEYAHLFTAALDASKENEWFEALRELICHLQDRQVWMSESKPADLLDDEFLFPMANSRYSTYVADSDIESLRGDIADFNRSLASTSGDTSYEDGGGLNRTASEHRVPPAYRPMLNGIPDSLYTSHYDNNSAYSPYTDFNRFHSTLQDNSSRFPEIYGTKETFASHFATVRRHHMYPSSGNSRPSIKPKPPPRTPSDRYHPPVAPKPSVVPPSPAHVPPSPLREGGAADAAASNKRDSNASTNTTSTSTTFDINDKPQPLQHSSPSKGEVPCSSRPSSSRQFPDPGYYDVKQVLAEQVDEFDRRTPSPPAHSAAAQQSPYARYNMQSVARYSPAMYDSPRHRPPYQGVQYRPPGPMPVMMGRPRPPPIHVPDQILPNAMSSPAYRESIESPPPVQHRHNINVNHVHVPNDNRYMPRSAPPMTHQRPVYNGNPSPHGHVPPPAPRSPMDKPTHRNEEDMSETMAAAVSSSNQPEVGSSYATTSASVFATNWKNASPRAIDSNKANSASPTAVQCNGQNGDQSVGSGLQFSNRKQGSAFDLYEASKTNNKDVNQNSKHVDNEYSDEEHTVVAHVSAVIGAEGGSLSSNETGVSIHVPAGALPEGADQEIYFKVCKVNQVDPPIDVDKGETLLSPLVMCGPQGLKFEKPVELRLPHSGQSQNGGPSSFALKSLLKSEGQSEAHWKQVTLAGPEHGTVQDNYVSVHIDHF